MVKWFDGSIARIHLNLGDNRPADAASGSENWLLVGTDSRAGSTGQFGDAPGERSDTTILAHLDADGTTTNVSIPRDTLVTIPEYRNSKKHVVPTHKDKFNSAIMDGGPSLLVRTVEALFQVRVDHYISVDLEGFAKISNALNGVPVCIIPAPASANEEGGLITNINDGYSNFHGKYGDQKVVGDQAVAFVRQRHGLPDSDLSRIKRQQQFLGSVFRTAFKVDLLFKPLAITRLLSAIKSAITLDNDTSLTDLEKLALRLRGVDPSKIVFETIPTRSLDFSDTDLGAVTPFEGLPGGIPTLTPTGQSDNVGSVQILDRAGFDVIQAKLQDQPPPSPGASKTTSSPPSVAKVTVPPSQVTVTVENGVGRNGLAGQVTKALNAEGFNTGAPGPADSTGYTTSVVRYAPGEQDAARTVAASVPGSVLKEDIHVSSGIVLVVGANYSTVLAVTVDGSSSTSTPTETPTPSVTPSTSPSPTAPPVTAASESNRCTY